MCACTSIYVYILPLPIPYCLCPQQAPLLAVALSLRRWPWGSLPGLWPLGGLPALGCCGFPWTPHCGVWNLTSCMAMKGRMIPSGMQGNEYPWNESWPMGSEMKGSWEDTPFLSPADTQVGSLLAGFLGKFRTRSAHSCQAASRPWKEWGAPFRHWVTFLCLCPASLLFTCLPCPGLYLANMLVSNFASGSALQRAWAKTT